MPIKNQNKNSVSTPSIEKIIDNIRIFRNTFTKKLLDDDYLNMYFQERFNKKLSTVKKEFLKRELNELLISPVDLVHYAGLINNLKENGALTITENDDPFFFREVDKILNKYAL